MSEEKIRRHPKIIRIIGAVLAGIAMATLFALLFGFLVRFLWNALMPAIFGLGKISYWQAFGLLILAKLLFGSFGHHHNHHASEKFHQRIDDRWHRFLGVESCRGREREVFEEYWQKEGKASYEAYIDRIEAREKDGE